MADRWVHCNNDTFITEFTLMPIHLAFITLHYDSLCYLVAGEAAAALLSDVCCSGQPCWNVLLASC